MKLVKSLLLGSAAGLIAVGGAQAADLPVKAKAVEYVKVCSLYGAGFYYIPGTDTCVKLGGYLRVDVLANTNSDHTGNTSGAGGAQNRFTNAYTWRSREDLTIDTRTATEYGVVRTFMDTVFSWTSDTYTGQANGSSLYGVVGTAAGGNNATQGSVAYGTVGVYYAFIQFAGFTMGKAVSQFSAPWANYPGNGYDGLVGGGGTITGVNQFTYTADFGQGVSASISAQDQTTYYQAGLFNVSNGGNSGFGASNYAGTPAPDIVGMVRVDQAWGLFQASVALHDNHAAYYSSLDPTISGTEAAGHPQDKWGWAGQLALSIKNIPTGPGDTINVSGVYTNGATRYNIQDLAASAGANTIYGGSNVPGVYQSIGLGLAPDTVFATGGSQQLISTWGFRGAYTHNWDPYWSTSVYGAYAGISYTGTAKQLICGGILGANIRATTQRIAGSNGTCNPDYSISQIGLVHRWTPVKNLTFSGEVTYTMLDQKMAGFIESAANTGIGKPAADYELKNQNTWMLLLRAQRNW